MKDYVGRHIAHERASVTDRSSIVAEVLCKVEGRLQDIVSSQSASANASNDVSRVPPSRDGLLLPWIDPALNCAILWICRRLIKFQTASSSRSKKDL